MVHAHEAYCQPCVSPVWDTGLACHALLEAGGERATAQARRGLDWLVPRQILDVEGDWIARRPHLRPGGWAFQYANPHYPDLDDTAVVVMAMDRAQKVRDNKPFQDAIERGREWICGLQSRNGGWGAFDADNEYLYLNNIPFADHGALLDPPTEDVTARCVSMLAQIGETAQNSKAMACAVDYLRRTQMEEGSWYGRWGMNYIYGTWSVLCALNAAGVDHASPEFRKAVAWLVRIQNADGGWGEDGTSYKLDYRGYEPAASTASQTAWALLALMAAGEVDHPAVERGIGYLARMQGEGGFWSLNVDSLAVSLALGVLGMGLIWWIVRGATSGVPNRRQAFVELAFEFIDDQVKGIFHHGDRNRFVAPAALTVFVWVLLMNAMDFLPVDIVASGTHFISDHGFRIVPTADINTTFALALSVWLLMIFFSIAAKESWSASRTTGTTRPEGVPTAMPMWTKFL